MFGVKFRLNAYLTQIAPFALGKDSRGWYPADFLDSDTRKMRLDPTHVIYNIPEPRLSWFDALFLNKEQYRAFINLRQVVSNFNAYLAVINSLRRDLQETYYNLMILLHASCIGSLGSGGLFDAYHYLRSVIS